MFQLSVENEYNQRIYLSSMPEYTIVSIDGLSPMDATIYEMRNTGLDGSIFNSSAAEPRVITMVVAINMPAEENRLNLYNYFKIKKKHRIFFSNDSRDVYIDGYLQSMPIGFFDEKQMATMVFRCPDPYFKEYAEIGLDIGNVISLFEFPFDIRKPIPFSEINIYGNKTIFNHGDVETGMIIRITGRDIHIENPKIVNVSTGEYIGIDGEIKKGEELVICTIDNHKYIKLIDGRSGSVTETNMMSYLMAGSSWIKIWPGENVFHLLCDYDGSQFMNGSIVVNTLYEGV